MDETILWDIRHFVYQHFAETTRPPSMEDVADHFALTHEKATSTYEELHQRHALFLTPGTHDILMANPFSSVETPFRVHANGKTYFANCAWDSLGIPAALHTDAQVDAFCAQSGEAIHIQVTDHQVQHVDAIIHFLLPFREWYNDLVYT